MKQSLTIRLRVVSTVKSVWTRCTTVLKEIIFTIYAPVIRSVFVLYYAVSTVGPRSIATAVETKNSPPDCFLNVSTVLKEIIFTIYAPVIRSVFVLYYAVSTVDPRSIATAVETKNSPPDCFINVSTVLKEIIFIHTAPLQKGAYFFCTTCFRKIRGNQIFTNNSELRKYIIVV